MGYCDLPEEKSYLMQPCACACGADTHRDFLPGHVHPLDDLTRDALVQWLNHPRTRWPSTANPYLIINPYTALDDRPVSKVWINDALRGQIATLERLRVDRQLDEALTHGPDPAVFGLADKTAIRYAAAARQILDTSAEKYTHEP